MIYFRSRGALYGEAWFGEAPSRDSGVDIVAYRQVDTPVRGADCRPFETLVTELAGPRDSIIGQFGKNCRQKINRAESRDRLQLELFTEPRNRLDEFRAFYDGFARQKALRPIDCRWLTGACEAGQLVLAAAVQDGETLVWHGYVTGDDCAWLRYSASAFRDGDGAYRSLVGRANRWLHWQSMLQFRALGLSRYDWGGMFEDESTAERAGINRFKREFRGREVRRYDCTRAVTARGRLRLFVHRQAERWRSLREGSGALVAGKARLRGLRTLLGR